MVDWLSRSDRCRYWGTSTRAPFRKTFFRDIEQRRRMILGRSIRSWPREFAVEPCLIRRHPSPDEQCLAAVPRSREDNRVSRSILNRDLTSHPGWKWNRFGRQLNISCLAFKQHHPSCFSQVINRHGTGPDGFFPLLVGPRHVDASPRLKREPRARVAHERGTSFKVVGAGSVAEVVMTAPPSDHQPPSLRRSKRAERQSHARPTF